jgi:hypothetical protein
VPDFATVVAGEEILEEHVNQFASWLNGDDSSFYAFASIIANDASHYAFSVQNIGTNGYGFRVRDSTGGVDLLTVSNLGITVGSTTLRIPLGTETSPSIALLPDTDTGIYSQGAGFLAFTSNGVTCFTVGPRVYAGMDGAAASPAYTWGSDGTVGIRRLSTGYAALSSTGSDMVLWNATGVGFNGQAPAAQPDYVVFNPSVGRSIDVPSATAGQIAAVLGTLINDLIAIGLLK